MTVVPDDDPQAGAHPGHAANSPLQRTSPDPSAAASPQPGGTTDLGTGPTATTDRARDLALASCTACGLPLHLALAAAEPWHTTHPACDQLSDLPHHDLQLHAAIAHTERAT